VIFRRFGDLPERLRHSLGDLARALTTRRPAYVLPRPESPRQSGISRPDLISDQALPRADMDLAQPLVGDDVEPRTLGEHRGGLITPRQVAGIQPGWPIGSQDVRCSDRGSCAGRGRSIFRLILKFSAPERRSCVP
jgi:hypothetical protein